MKIWSDPDNVPRRLDALLADAETLLGVTITVKDRLGLLRDADGSPLFAEHAIHNIVYCQLERNRDVNVNHTCRRYCNEEVPKIALENMKPFTSCCYRGAVEVVVPVFHAGSLAFLLHAGAFRDAGGSRRPSLRDFPPAVREAYPRLPVLTEEAGGRIARVLDALGKTILQEALRLQQDSGAGAGRGGQILRFLHARAHQKLTLQDMAQALNISASRASHVIKELTGDSFQNLLMKERVARAKSLLLASEMSLKQIAEACGFSNEYYFNKQFRKLAGTPPGRFAAAERKSTLRKQA